MTKKRPRSDQEATKKRPRSDQEALRLNLNRGRLRYRSICACPAPIQDAPIRLEYFASQNLGSSIQNLGGCFLQWLGLGLLELGLGLVDTKMVNGDCMGNVVFCSISVPKHNPLHSMLFSVPYRHLHGKDSSGNLIQNKQTHGPTWTLLKRKSSHRVPAQR